MMNRENTIEVTLSSFPAWINANNNTCIEYTLDEDDIEYNDTLSDVLYAYLKDYDGEVNDQVIRETISSALEYFDLVSKEEIFEDKETFALYYIYKNIQNIDVGYYTELMIDTLQGTQVNEDDPINY